MSLLTSNNLNTYELGIIIEFQNNKYIVSINKKGYQPFKLVTLATKQSYEYKIGDMVLVYCLSEHPIIIGTVNTPTFLMNIL